ncbi:MAG: PcfJ domain-containing protein [Dysgonomonas mossii]|uniref:PcfJ domain-containing protein n=1 Tax=Dysgonomonas mossii TaxID=163665 RepID=UPI001D80ED89|nr:PcfJ domain-containing protein [Dysgonomonas mossii]MBS5798068.1 PcfJ domain-containing protein [Dysgonomonas mossii]MBS7112606.1 PcfJ domain-containing protein [Dysgonomonas mossii]
MQPKNKFQQQVVETSKTLPAITKEQVQWGYDNAIEYLGYRSKKGIITCSKCGHSWQGEGELITTILGCDCRNCKSKLTVKATAKRTFNDSYYMTVIDTHKGYQVLRTIMLGYTSKIGELPKYSASEVMQRWIASDGKYCTFAKLRQTMGTMYYDSWIFHTPLELRQEIDVYNRIYTGAIYPKQKLIPELKRTGYKKALYNQKPLDLFRILLTDSKAETLIKTTQVKLLKRIMDSGWKNIDNYWQSIRICIRNNYDIKDATLWCDYIDLLRFFDKDLHNAKYVCPTDLKAEHNLYVAKKAKADAQLEIEKQLAKEDSFRDAKAKFFGLIFSDGLINVRVLESVAEIINEGKAMHHCVGSYHSKEDSLILSACIDGKRIETIEVSISQLKVIQSRGVCNKNTKYHDRIVNLVNQNIPLIEERLAA